MDKLLVILKDIKVQHTIFALPFAVMSAFLAAEGLPTGRQLFWIVMCMVSARSAAMAFNRIADARIDAVNPRTKGRALPSGAVKAAAYWVFLIAASAVFIASAGMLNRLALMLSPLALIIVFFYSLTKRFTWSSHLFLGLALSVAPVGAWVAIREEISLLSMVLGAAVIFWLAGFDILYACLDVENDRRHRLNSVPQRFGVDRALKLAGGSHVVMVVFLLGLLISPLLGWFYFTGVLLVAGLLWYEHSLVKPNDLTKVNIAFFNVNGVISVLLMATVIADCMWLQ